MDSSTLARCLTLARSIHQGWQLPAPAHVNCTWPGLRPGCNPPLGSCACQSPNRATQRISCRRIHRQPCQCSPCRILLPGYHCLRHGQQHPPA
jgi:hypothetical protein